MVTAAAQQIRQKCYPFEIAAARSTTPDPEESSCQQSASETESYSYAPPHPALDGPGSHFVRWLAERHDAEISNTYET